MLKHRFVPRNMIGHDYAVGDVHGEFHKLQEALDFVGFDPKKDRLFFVGDLVDKGRYSRQAYNWLSKPWVFAALGNHDWHVANWTGDMESLWIKNWGAWFAKLNPVFRKQMADIFKEKLSYALTVDTPNGFVGIVHAGTPYSTWIETVSAIANGEKRDAFKPFMFERKYYEGEHTTKHIRDLHAMLVGHCPTKSGEIERRENTFYLDTDGYITGDFKLLCINRDRLY